MTRKIASRSAAVAFLALGTLPNVALAEPVNLTDAQMDQVNAGAFRFDATTHVLTDRYDNVYTPTALGGVYQDSNGTEWVAQLGIDLRPDGYAYGYLLGNGVAWDGGIVTWGPEAGN